MNADSLQLFKQLTEMAGASGFERDVRAFMKQEISKYTNDIVQDRLGSLFGVLRSQDEQAPKVMVAGHMDEVGFIVTAITPHGTIKFQPLGGWWDQVLLAQRVQVMTPAGPVIGVIGSTPPHLLQDKDRSQVVTMGQMYIDIGADSAEQAAELGVRQGQQIVPVCPFTPMANPKKIMAKAWDNRYGVGLALELLQALHDQALPNTLYAGATVQEEVGLRGAATAATLINPDIFYALDAGPAGDMTGDRQAFGQLGKGALLRFFDRSMVTNPQLVDFIQDIALTHRIPYQFYMSPGGTDAGRVHTHGIGVPSAVIAICSRYIHTSASIIHVDDYAAAKELLIRLVQSTDRSMLDTILA